MRASSALFEQGHRPDLQAKTRPGTRAIVALALIAALLATASPAGADPEEVGNIEALTGKLNGCGGTEVAPLEIQLTGNINATGTSLSIPCYVVLDLNGHSLTTAGITIETGKHLTITDNSSGAPGTLTATAVNEAAGIQTTGASLTIEGGSVIATGGPNGTGAGIGGTNQGNGGAVTVHGGTVTAIGGPNGAGIGGGQDGKGGSTTITGGTVTAQGGLFSAGIGGNRKSGGSTIITGGSVTARGGTHGAGIGGGHEGEGGTTTITGGTVEAIGGVGGAGIGGGGHDGVSSPVGTSSGGTVTIEGGTVTAQGGPGAAGIGGGYHSTGARGNGGIVTITAGDVTATGGADGAGVGGGQIGNGGTVAIDGGTVTASGWSAVGHGQGGSIFGSLSLAGTLRVPSGDLVVPNDSDDDDPEVQITATGRLLGSEADATQSFAITGDGQIANSGVISLAAGNVSPAVFGNHFEVTFDPAGGSPTPDPVVVFASSFADGHRDFPADPARPGHPFEGWFTQPEGNGDEVTGTAVLPGASPDGLPVEIDLYAAWASTPPAPGGGSAPIITDPTPDPDPVPPARVLPTPPAEALTDTPEGAVHRLYLSLFNRVADPAGLDYWADQYRAGRSAASITLAMINTPEGRAPFGDLDPDAPANLDLLDALYRNLLGREPDPGGWTHWANLINNGDITVGRLIASFALSPEMAALIHAAFAH